MMEVRVPLLTRYFDLMEHFCVVKLVKSASLIVLEDFIVTITAQMKFNLCSKISLLI